MCFGKQYIDYQTGYFIRPSAFRMGCMEGYKQVKTSGCSSEITLRLQNKIMF